MAQFDQKQKRKHTGRNPYFLYLALSIGIAIGALFTLVIALLVIMPMIAGNQEIVPPLPIVVTVTTDDFSAQSVEIQPTVVSSRIQASAIAPDGAHLAVVSVEAGVSHIYLTELNVRANLSGQNYDLYQSYGYFSDITFSPDSSKMIATIDSGSAILFDVRNRTVIEEFPNIGGADFTADSQQLVLVGRNNGIRILDISSDTVELVDQLIRSDGFFTVGAVDVNANGQIAVGLDTSVAIYQIGNLEQAPVSLNLNMGFVHDVAFSPDGENLAIAVDDNGSMSGNIVIHNLDANSRTFFDFGTRIFALAFSPDGEWLAGAGGESGAGESRLITYRWDTSNTPIPPNPTYFNPVEFTGHNHTIYDVGFTADGYLLSSSWDGSVRLWDISQPDNAVSVYYP